MRGKRDVGLRKHGAIDQELIEYKLTAVLARGERAVRNVNDFNNLWSSAETKRDRRGGERRFHIHALNHPFEVRPPRASSQAVRSQEDSNMAQRIAYEEDIFIWGLDYTRKY